VNGLKVVDHVSPKVIVNLERVLQDIVFVGLVILEKVVFIGSVMDCTRAIHLDALYMVNVRAIMIVGVILDTLAMNVRNIQERAHSTQIVLIRKDGVIPELVSVFLDMKDYIVYFRQAVVGRVLLILTATIQTENV
jgi:hypothetical protein